MRAFAANQNLINIFCKLWMVDLVLENYEFCPNQEVSSRSRVFLHYDPLRIGACPRVRRLGEKCVSLVI